MRITLGLVNVNAISQEMRDWVKEYKPDYKAGKACGIKLSRALGRIGRQTGDRGRLFTMGEDNKVMAKPGFDMANSMARHFKNPAMANKDDDNWLGDISDKMESRIDAFGRGLRPRVNPRLDPSTQFD